MDSHVYPDLYVDSVLSGLPVKYSSAVFLTVTPLRGPACSIPGRYVVHLQCSRPLRGFTCSIPERYVVSPAVFLTVAWSHLQCSWSLRGLTCNIPGRYVVSPAVVMTALGQDL